MNTRTLHASYTPNYFSLDDILATNQKVPCKVQRNLMGLGEYCRKKERSINGVIMNLYI